MVKVISQYGGWCATNIAARILTVPRYDLYHIQNGKLYLFERTLSVNGKEIWLNNVEQNEQTAYDNYNFLTRHGVFPKAQ
jgi:hypothetical protein